MGAKQRGRREQPLVRFWRIMIIAFGTTLACAGTVYPQNPVKDSAEAEALRKADVAFHAGYAATQAGQLEEARKQFAEVVRLAPGIAEGHEALGSVLSELGRPAEAVPELELAAKLKSGDAGIEGDLAIALTLTGQGTEAISHFVAALKLTRQPEDAGFYDSYGRALMAADKPADALLEFEEEEKLTGAQASVDDAMGTAEAQLQRWDDARTAFERAVEEDGKYTPARVHLGMLLLRQRDAAGALKVLEPAAGATPASADALTEDGHALEDVGRDQDAVTVLQKALQTDPNVHEAAGELAMALQRLGRQQESIPWFEKAVAADPHDSAMFTNLALALTLTGKAREAMPFFAEAQELDPKNATIVKDRGVAHIQLSAFDEAITDFKQALAMDPSDPQLHYDLGLAYKFKDRMDDAVAELSKAGEMDPTLEDPPYTLGILYMQMGRLDDAVVEMRKAVALRPDNGAAWAILGSTLKQDERLEEAKEALEKAIPLQPGQPGPRVTLAGVLADMAAKLNTQAETADSAGDAAKAEQLRAQAKKLRGNARTYREEAATLSQAAVNRQRANFLLNAGNQLLLRGQIADAIARYQESIAADATFAEPHSQLALAYDRQGRAQAAAEEREKAAALEKSAN